MKIKTDFCLDHISIAQSNRDRALYLLSLLGFTTGDTYTARTVHYIFDNAYFEICTYLSGQVITWLGNTVPATNLPKVHSYRVSVKGTDPNPMRNSLLAAGIEEIGEINPPFTQFVRYGESYGDASYQTFFIKNFEPFTDVLFGATTHLTKDLIVKSVGKFTHPNGVKRIDSIGFYSNSDLSKIESNISRLYSAIEATTDKEYCINQFVLYDSDGYKSEFGVEPPIDERLFPAVSIQFSGAYLPYIKQRVFELDLKSFCKENKVYIDLRRNLGVFMVFAE